MQSKNIVVVGGSHGIGLGVVHRCVQRAAHVTVVSRTVGDLGGLPGVRHLPLDVTQDALPADSLPNPIHGFVYCPGSINLAPLRSIDAQMMRDDYELNVVGAVRCLQAALPGLKAAGGASAVFFSTVAVGQGLPMHTSVAAAKGAIEALVRTWAAELSPAVRVNGIAPALTNTPLAEKFLSSEDKRKAMAARYPLGRFGEIDDIAAATEYLLSEQSSWMTGQVLGVDGGMSTVRK
jgi:3-oxoacyl-[acyl-carrier protein] reductase